MTNIEISVDSLESAVAAERGGAQRVELCSALSEGGLTPSLGLIRAARAAVTIGLFVIIRPRSGDFLYSEEEFRIMREDIAIAAGEGVDGVVLGLLTAEGDVDVARTRELVNLARPMQVTFHRAFDMARDLGSALEDVIQSGADRILTSGGAPTALLGASRIAQMVDQAGQRITLLAGGGVRPANIEELAHLSGAHEFHSSMRRSRASAMRYRNEQLSLGEAGSEEYLQNFVATEEVRELVRAAQSVSVP